MRASISSKSRPDATARSTPASSRTPSKEHVGPRHQKYGSRRVRRREGRAITYLWLCFQGILHVRLAKGLQTALLVAPLRPGKKFLPELILQQRPPPPSRPLVNGRAQFGQVPSVRVPEPAANEARPRLAVDVVACVGSLPACAGEGDAEVRLVGGWIVAEADVSVYAEDDVLEGQFWDSGVYGDDPLHQAFDVAVPVLQGAAVFGVIGCSKIV